MEESRNKTLNFIKGIACIAVVFIHVVFPGKFGLIVMKLAQSVVPIFIMIAGYYALNRKTDTIRRRLLHIIHIFLFSIIWYLLYSILTHFLEGNLIQWIRDEISIETIVKLIVFVNLDFAIPLWYLIGMIEVYLVWYFVVKHGKEDLMLRFMPLMFLCHFLLTSFVETIGLPWSLKMNFVTRAFDWFLLGYYIHKNRKRIVSNINGLQLTAALIFGIIVSLEHIVFRIKIDFSCVGLFIISTTLFLIAVMYGNVSISKAVEFIGDKLSLNVYIFHPIIGGLFVIVAERLMGIDTVNGAFPWVNPILTVVASIVVAYMINVFKKGKV